MNLSNIITRIKLKLGLMAIASPFEDIDGTIADIIKDITVPVFSIYQPYREKMNVRTYDLELVDKGSRYEKYNLPEFKTRTLLYVFDVRYDEDSLAGLGFYGGGMPLMQGGLTNQVMLANAGKGVMNYMIPKLTFNYEPPRTLTLYNLYSSSRLILDLGFEHDKSLASIPETCRESFLELALLDVKENLYPTMRPYNELQTAIGNINLHLEGWESAESDRRELISRWDDTYHLDMDGIYYI